MKSLALIIVAALGLTACSDFDESPERKEVLEFLQLCKDSPQTPVCVEWKKEKNNLHR